MASPRQDQPGYRIVVGGVSGCGKTTLAKALAERLEIAYICNDEIIHRPNWQPASPAEREAGFEAATRGGAWVIDGNFISLMDPEDVLVFSRADTLVWLDLPRRVAFPQLLYRTVWRAATKEPLWHGNRESFRLSFVSRESILLWAIRTHGLYRQRYAAFFADPPFPHLRLIRLRSRREVRAWLGRCVPRAAAAGAARWGSQAVANAAESETPRAS